MPKFEPMEGVEYIYCQHIREGKSEDAEELRQWIGENLRVILCPICTGVAMKDALEIMSNRIDHIIRLIAYAQEKANANPS